MKLLKPIGDLFLPAVLFYVIYNAVGIIPAVMVSLLYSFGSVIYSKYKGNAIKNSQTIGILGLLSSAAAIIFTGDEKLYYVPSLFGNTLFLGFMAVLSVRRKSVLHYLAKDFDIKSLQVIPEEKMLRINLVWILYFALKIISKLAGILYLDFNKLYWLVFILGDPMTILVIVISVILIRMPYSDQK
ncbi:MAG: septation protein IspZ [Lachnospiraceae bacterium]|nr:septation protein IspZ [Lachnospiraceae bacterium]